MYAYKLFILGVFITCSRAQTPLQEDVIEALERIDRDVNAMGSAISDVTHQSVLKIIPQISGISDTLWLSTAQASLTKVGDSLRKFKTSDTTDQISGSLDILSAFAAVLPGAGPLVAGFFGFASGLVGILGNGSKRQIGVGEIVSKSIEGPLRRYDDESLQSEAWGVRHEFTVSQAFLNAMVNATLTETDILLMSSNVPVYRGARFFGVLEYKINQKKAATSGSDSDMVLSYVMMYCELSTSRQSILSQLQFKIQDFSYISSVGSAIQSVIDHTKLVERNVLEFLVHPEPEHLIVVSIFVPSIDHVITEFLADRNIPVRSVSTRFKSLCLEDPMQTYNQNANFHTCLSDNRSCDPKFRFYLIIHDSKVIFLPVDDPSLSEFYFTQEGNLDEDNYLYIQQRQGSMRYIVFDSASLTMKGKATSDPGESGKWKVIELEINGCTYLVLSPKRFPQGFVRAVYSGGDNGDWIAKIDVGDPGEKGYLRICR